MARPTTKEELLKSSLSSFEKLLKLIDSIPKLDLERQFDFSKDLKKKEAHWNRDKNLRDILIHLYEWHCLLLLWVNSNMSGKNVDFLPSPYTWKTYGEMNIKFWEKHQETKLETAKEKLLNSHKDVLELIKSFTDEELFTKKFYSWTGTTSLGSYCVSASSSHYEWAIKKLRAHLKNCANK